MDWKLDEEEAIGETWDMTIRRELIGRHQCLIR